MIDHNLDEGSDRSNDQSGHHEEDGSLPNRGGMPAPEWNAGGDQIPEYRGGVLRCRLEKAEAEIFGLDCTDHTA